MSANLAACAIVSRWLEANINTYLATVPLLFPSDGPLKAVAYVGNEFEDDRVAQAEAPPKTPALYVLWDAPANVTAELATNTHRDFEGLVVSVRVLLERSTHDAKAMRDLDYYGRAVIRCLRALLDNDQAPQREMLGVELVGATGLTFSPFQDDAPGDILSGAVIVTLFLRDWSPV